MEHPWLRRHAAAGRSRAASSRRRWWFRRRRCFRRRRRWFWRGRRSVLPSGLHILVAARRGSRAQRRRHRHHDRCRQELDCVWERRRERALLGSYSRRAAGADLRRRGHGVALCRWLAVLRNSGGWHHCSQHSVSTAPFAWHTHTRARAHPPAWMLPVARGNTHKSASDCALSACVAVPPAGTGEAASSQVTPAL